MTDLVDKVEDPKAKAFLEEFFLHRNINREVYEKIPEEKFGYRMVHTSERKSDSPRDSLIHQINVTRSYISGIKTGILHFKNHGSSMLRLKSKNELLIELDKTGEELVKILSNTDISIKTVKVSWSKKPISAIISLRGLCNHEVLHTGWNLALMDHLNIERFQALKNVWG